MSYSESLSKIIIIEKLASTYVCQKFIKKNLKIKKKIIEVKLHEQSGTHIYVNGPS
jgi:hypothetical protein